MNIILLFKRYFGCCKNKEEKVHPFPLKVSKNPYNY